MRLKTFKDNKENMKIVQITILYNHRNTPAIYNKNQSIIKIYKNFRKEYGI